MSRNNGSPVFTRADLAAKRAELIAKTELIDVPEWGGAVRLRVMTGTERDAYEAEIVGNRAGKDRRLNLANLRARFVARCLIDNDGNALFDWRNPKDIDELGSMPAAGLDTIFKAAQRINGLTDDDVNDLAGKSNAEANDNSGSN